MDDTFVLKIQLGNDAMQTGGDVADVLLGDDYERKTGSRRDYSDPRKVIKEFEESDAYFHYDDPVED